MRAARAVLFGGVLISSVFWANLALPETRPLFAKESAVVLLVGLAGDTETEHAYQEQLQTWLEVLARPALRQVFVLCDREPSTTAPSSLRMQYLPNNRTNFLSLTQKLDHASSSVVVIAWGHGGSQGATPVFHVHGPRLTPADFSTVAGSLSNSTWLLYFRGSGAFARQVAARGPAVVSSDRDTAFTSDPIGMPVLLKIIRGNPDLTLEELAHRVGAGTSGWYSERGLARTEEPMLWLPGHPPERLAVEERDSSLSGPPSGTPTVSEAKPARSPGPAEASAETSAHAQPGPPPSWRALSKVDPDRYPDSDAVILWQSLTCTVGAHPAVSTEQEQYIQILNAEGKKFGDFDVSYSPPEEEIEFLDCEVLRPDGTFLRADPESFGRSEEHPVGDYRSGQRRFFSLPGMVPGAVLRVHYRTQWKEFPLPSISMALPIAQDLPVVDASLQVTVPKQDPFHFAFEGVSAPDPQVRQTTYSTSYVWHLQNTPASSREALSPPRQGAQLFFSTFRDWAAFAGWYGRITRLTAETTPDLIAKAKELTGESGTETEKVRALYNYVTSLRYVAVPLGVNTLRPHAAANVLRNQFGDCKDKANLLNALLQAVGISAHLVLVPRFNQAQEAVPGLAFNHAISRVKVGSDLLWLDTTDDICRFGLLPPGDPGRKVLVIDDTSDALSELPPPDPKQNRVQLDAEIDASGREPSWPVTLRVATRGFPDYQFREAARDTHEDMGSIPLLAVRWRPVAGSFASDHQTMTSISQLDQDFSWEAKGSLIGLSSQSAEKTSLRSPFWLPKEWDLALHQRRAPLFLNRGYPLAIEENFRVRLPASGPKIGLPSPCENAQPPLRWGIEWTRVAGDQLLARFHAELVRGDLPATDTAAFQQQLRALLSALAAEASYNSAQ